MALLDFQSPNGLCLKQQQNCPEYSDGPNIQGGISGAGGIFTTTGFGALTGSGAVGNTLTSSTASKDYWFNLNFDASIGNSIYKNNLSEVRVNALFGLQLIKAY